MQNVFVFHQFFDCAVAFAKQVINRWAAVLSVGLPEVCVQETKIHIQSQNVRILCLASSDDDQFTYPPKLIMPLDVRVKEFLL